MDLWETFKHKYSYTCCFELPNAECVKDSICCGWRSQLYSTILHKRINKQYAHTWIKVCWSIVSFAFLFFTVTTEKVGKVEFPASYNYLSAQGCVYKEIHQKVTYARGWDTDVIEKKTKMRWVGFKEIPTWYCLVTDSKKFFDLVVWMRPRFLLLDQYKTRCVLRSMNSTFFEVLIFCTPYEVTHRIETKRKFPSQCFNFNFNFCFGKWSGAWETKKLTPVCRVFLKLYIVGNIVNKRLHREEKNRFSKERTSSSGDRTQNFLWSTLMLIWLCQPDMFQIVDP